jgi:hypothetical protein
VFQTQRHAIDARKHLKHGRLAFHHWHASIRAHIAIDDMTDAGGVGNRHVPEAGDGYVRQDLYLAVAEIDVAPDV